MPLNYGSPFQMFARPFSAYNVGKPLSTPFSRIRGVTYVIVIICASIILGLSIDLAKKLLPSSSAGFLIFSLVAAGATILIFITLLIRSTPRTDATALPILDLIWLILSILATTNSTSYCNNSSNSSSNCTELRVALVLSWVLFFILMLSFEIILILVYRTRSYGRPFIWSEDISRLAWFRTPPPAPLLTGPDAAVAGPVAGTEAGIGVGAGEAVAADGMGVGANEVTGVAGVEGMGATGGMNVANGGGMVSTPLMSGGGGAIQQQQQQQQQPMLQSTLQPQLQTMMPQTTLPPPIITEIYDRPHHRDHRSHHRSRSRDHDRHRSHSQDRDHHSHHHRSSSRRHHHRSSNPQVITTTAAPMAQQGPYYQQPVTYQPM